MRIKLLFGRTYVVIARQENAMFCAKRSAMKKRSKTKERDGKRLSVCIFSGRSRKMCANRRVHVWKWFRSENRRDERIHCRRHLNATKRRVKRKSLTEFSGRPLARLISKRKKNKKKQFVNWTETRLLFSLLYVYTRAIFAKEKQQKKRITPAIISMHHMVGVFVNKTCADLIYTQKCVKYIVLLELYSQFRMCNNNMHELAGHCEYSRIPSCTHKCKPRTRFMSV